MGAAQRIDNEKRIQDFADDDKKISNELAKINKEAIGVPNLFGSEPMIKISKKSFDKLIKICKSVSSFKQLFYRKEAELALANKQIVKLQEGENALKERNSALERFIKEKGFAEAFKKFLEPKSIREYIRNYKVKQAENNRAKSKETSRKYNMER